MRSKKSFPITNIGSVSLMMVFIVLCMVTFAALSLAETMRDYQFSQTLSEHTTAYYTASSQAEEQLAAIDMVLVDAASAGTDTDTDSYYGTITDALKDYTNITISYDDNQTMLLSYQTPLNDSQALSVGLRIPAITVADAGTSVRYIITSWCEIPTSEWEGDNTLQLIQ